MSKKIILLQTKGGVGKGFIGKDVLPFWFARDMLTGGETESFPIRGYELENSNSPKDKVDEYFVSGVIRFSDDTKTENVDEAKLLTALDRIAMEHKDIVSIVNFGGGSDTQSIINAIDKTLLDDFVFVVPFFSDYESINGARTTVLKLRSSGMDLKIVMVANKLNIKAEDGNTKSILGLASGGDKMLEKMLVDIKCPISYVPEFSEKDEMPIIKSMPQSTISYFKDIIAEENPQEREILKKIRDELESDTVGGDLVEAFMERSKKVRADMKVFRRFLECRHLYETIKAL